VLPPISGSTQSYLDQLTQMQTEMNNLQEEVTSGYRVQRPSDDPAAVGGILSTQNRIGQLQQNNTNLGQLQTELQTGDGALQQAVQAMDSAVSLASQSSSLMSNSAQQSALLQQAQGILQTLVNISATNADGRYIFSGDLDQQVLYAVDPTQPTGVKQLATATSTRTVTDAAGSPIWTGITASTIFDARNANGSPATQNVFAAVNSLITALQSNDTAGAINSITSLKAAGDYLNQQLGQYGIAENRVTDTLNNQNALITSDQQQLSGLRDTNVASAALQLNQLQVQQEAALTSKAKMGQMSLFNFLA
jgi:flagellar hook-associated protein 3 FlgL